MKKILGLDLGTTSIGWALVNEAENDNETSIILKIGARIIHYGDNMVKVDEKGKISPSMELEKDFQSGKGVSSNAGRTLKRGTRRNLQRYKLRRNSLINELTKIGFIDKNSCLAEEDKNTTHQTYSIGYL